MLTALSPGEFGLISDFVSAFDRAGPGVRVGPGDDCAVLLPQKGELCVTTDAIFEGVHFTRPYFSFENIGHKALAVNLSDLAAMGAAPSWFQCAIAMPASVTSAAVREMARSMAKLAREHGCVLTGGNFTRASELSITITAAGTVSPGSALLRSSARANDALYVSGTLGDSAMALGGVVGSPTVRALTGGVRTSDRRSGRAGVKNGSPRPSAASTRHPGSDRQRRPRPRVALGLIARRFAHAAIDISDGFLQDLAHVCLASSVRAEIDVASLPLSRGVRAAGEQGLRWALIGGEDYELILAVPGRRAAAFERACAQAGEKVIRVGTFVAGGGIGLVNAPSGLSGVALGHDHFIDAPVSGD